MALPQPSIQPNYDEEIAEIVHNMRQYYEQIAALEQCVREDKVRLRNLLEQRGSNWSDDTGYARLTTQSVRTSYDTKALDSLIIADPLRNGWLKEYRKESIVPSTIQVK